jgi:hypothetical protein
MLGHLRVAFVLSKTVDDTSLDLTLNQGPSGIIPLVGGCVVYPVTTSFREE